LRSEKPTWRISVDHKLTPDIMVYASYNRGSKTGGFNDQILPVLSYAPETLDAYEVGSKADFLDHRLQLDKSAFYYSYSNIQTVS
jgi:iron complex outermembrane recepter protein